MTFFGISMKADLFQSCGHCWVFPSLLTYQVQHFHSIIIWTWNSSTGIPSLPLALFIVMLPKAHLTWHSRMLALGEWSHHHAYLAHENLFLDSPSVYSCHLLISSASVRSLPFLSFIEPIFAWKVSLGISNFLEEISSLSHSIVFLYFFALITSEEFLSSLCYSLELCI